MEVSIQAHLLTDSPRVKDVIEDTLLKNPDTIHILHYTNPKQLIQSLQATACEAGFCLIEERALKGITRKVLSEILSYPIFTIFVKNSENFFLNTPEKSGDMTPIFIGLNELTPTFISLFTRISGQEFQAREALRTLEDSKMKQTIYVHEMRNPLTVIKGKCQSILKSIPPSQKSDPWIQEVIQDCEKILSSCEKIKSIGESVFTNTQLETSSLDSLETKPQQLAELVWSSMEEVAMGFEIPVEIIDNIEPIEISCNKQAFEGALINLIKNAYEAVKEQPKPWIKITNRVKNDSVILQVVDSGHGIKDANRIFEPYYTTKQQLGGKGVGLQVVQKYFHRIGGHIKYKKNENGNTCFEVEFPLSPTTE